LAVLTCKRCNNIWNYKGTNQYCANCSRCKSTVFIKKASLSEIEKSNFQGAKQKIIANGVAVTKE